MFEKKTIFSIFIFSPIFLFAQKAQIQGVVVDAVTKQPIAGASVGLLSQQTKGYLRGQQSDEQGKFTISNLDPFTYAVRVTFVGYDELLRENLVITSGQQVALDTIKMVEQSELISEVVVQGKLPDMQIGIDRKIFDVSQSMVSVGGTASDLLANVPTLQVDQDGAVNLRGSSGVKILIDGKESAMAGSDIGSLLQSLPAEVIEKVEIITNPSSKYDAEGQSGIVNIILKKNARIGFNGTATASVGSYENAMAGVTLNYRDKKFNHFGNYNFNRRINLGDGYNENIRLVDGNYSDQSLYIRSDNEARRQGHNHTLRLGSDYFMSEKTTISFSGNLSLRSNDRSQDLFYQYRNFPERGNGGSRNSQQFEDDLGLDLQLDFQQRLKREGEELSANVSFGYDTEDGTNNFDEYIFDSQLDVIRRNVTTEKGKNWNVQIDYILPLGQDHKFEAGYRSIIRNSEDTQDSEVARGGSEDLQPDYFLSNNFDLNSSVHALYVNYQRQLTSKIGAQVGLRAEQANLTSKYYNLDPTMSLNDAMTEGKLDYFRLYPSVFLTHAVGSGTDKIQLSYSRRVQRPRGWQVNPFINASDELNLMQGNPNMMPEDIHSLELGFSKFYEKWNFVTSAFYRRVNDMIMPIQYESSEIEDLPAEYGNAIFRRWGNIGSSNAYGVELISKVNLTNWWDAMANANVFYNKMRPIPELDVREVNNVNWDANLTTNVKFMPTLSLQARGGYWSGRKGPQGNMKDMWGVDVAVKKDFFRNKASVMLNVRDVFNSRMFKMDSHLNNNIVNFGNRWNRRMINLTFTYKFGIQDLFKKDDESPEEGTPGGGMGEGF